MPKSRRRGATAHGWFLLTSGGDDRDRTGDLLVANEALSQLSYIPTDTARHTLWRRERDSNPRTTCMVTRFPTVLLQPLGHLSGELIGRTRAPSRDGRQKWRRERDSNPRYGCPYSGFRDRPIQPLSHLSAGEGTRIRGRFPGGCWLWAVVCGRTR